MWIVRAAIAAALAIWRRWRALAVFALAELCAELRIGPVKAAWTGPAWLDRWSPSPASRCRPGMP